MCVSGCKVLSVCLTYTSYQVQSLSQLHNGGRCTLLNLQKQVLVHPASHRLQMTGDSVQRCMSPGDERPSSRSVGLGGESRLRATYRSLRLMMSDHLPAPKIAHTDNTYRQHIQTAHTDPQLACMSWSTSILQAPIFQDVGFFSLSVRLVFLPFSFSSLSLQTIRKNLAFRTFKFNKILSWLQTQGFRWGHGAVDSETLTFLVWN